MFNTIDLFAGCGGLSEGFKQSGKFRVLAGVEWDNSAAMTLKNRLSQKWGYKNASDIILNFDIQRTDELISGFKNDIQYGSSRGLDKLVNSKKIDVVIGGPPCQAYSIAGRIQDKNRMQNDYRNFLFESYINVVKHFRPKACIFENVQGMLSAAPGGTPIVERVTNAFDAAGYYITTDLRDDALFDTSDFEVPQKRLRIIIIALDKKYYPDYKEKVGEFYSRLNEQKTERKVTVSEALANLPKIHPIRDRIGKSSHRMEFLKTEPVSSHEPRFHNSRDIQIFQFLAEDIQSGRNQYIHSSALKMLYSEKTGRTSSVHKYHVLRADKPSNTIPAHLYKDGLRHIHPDPAQARTITAREAARLQTFDDDFEFYGAMGAKYKMIGNAVPPRFSKKIAYALAKTL